MVNDDEDERLTEGMREMARSILTNLSKNARLGKKWPSLPDLVGMVPKPQGGKEDYSEFMRTIAQLAEEIKAEHIHQQTAQLRAILIARITQKKGIQAEDKEHLKEWAGRIMAANLFEFVRNEKFQISPSLRGDFESAWRAYLTRFNRDEDNCVVSQKTYWLLDWTDKARERAKELAEQWKTVNKSLEKPLFQEVRLVDDLEAFRAMLQEIGEFFSLPAPEDAAEDWITPLARELLAHEAKRFKKIREEAEARAAERQAAKKTPAERKRDAVRVEMANDGITRYPAGGLGIMPEMMAAARLADNGLLSFDSGEEVPLIVVPGSHIAIRPQTEQQTALQFKDLDKLEHLRAAQRTSVFKDVVLEGLKGMNSPYTMDTYATTLLELLIRVDSGLVDGHSVKTLILWDELERRMDLEDLGKDAILARQRAAYAMYAFIMRNPVVFKGNFKGKLHTMETPIFELSALFGEGKDKQLFTSVQAAIGETMAFGLFGVGAPKKNLACSLLDVTAITHTPFNKAGRTNDLRITYQLTKTAIDGRTYNALYGKNQGSGVVTLAPPDIVREILPQPNGTGAALRVANKRQRETMQKVCAAMVQAGAVKTAKYTEHGEIIAEPCYRMTDACDKLASAHKAAKADATPKKGKRRQE